MKNDQEMTAETETSEAVTSSASTSNASASEETSSRRPMLSMGMAAVASVVLGGFAMGCSDDDKNGSGGGPDSGTPGNPDSGTPNPDADVASLNALLNAEYLAITAYSAGAGLIGKAPSSDPLYSLRNEITSVAVNFQSQHKLHAAALVDAIGGLKGTPVKEADVAATFKPPAGLVDNPTITNVLKFAATAERGAAVAYNQVLAGMEAAKFRFLATAIEGDETQHFIILTALIAGLAAPGPNLTTTTAVKLPPMAFVSTVGAQGGLDKGPADYFP